MLLFFCLCIFFAHFVILDFVRKANIEMNYTELLNESYYAWTLKQKRNNFSTIHWSGVKNHPIRFLLANIYLLFLSPQTSQCYSQNFLGAQETLREVEWWVPAAGVVPEDVYIAEKFDSRHFRWQSQEWGL